MDYLLRPDLYPGREEFSVKDTAKKATTGIADAGKKFLPFIDFMKKIWGWLKWVCLVVLFCCCSASCMFLGIPQTAYTAISNAASAT